MTERPHLVSVGSHNEAELAKRDKETYKDVQWVAMDVPFNLEAAPGGRELSKGLKYVESQLPDVRIDSFHGATLRVQRGHDAKSHSSLEDLKFLLEIYVPGVELEEPVIRELREGEDFYGIKRDL